MLLQYALHNNFNIVYIITAVYVHFFILCAAFIQFTFTCVINPTIYYFAFNNYFLSFKRFSNWDKNVFCIYSHTYYFWPLSLIFIHIFFCYQFSSAWRNSFNIHCSAGLLENNYLRFQLFEKYFSFVFMFEWHFVSLAAFKIFLIITFFGQFDYIVHWRSFLHFYLAWGSLSLFDPRV